MKKINRKILFPLLLIFLLLSAALLFFDDSSLSSLFNKKSHIPYSDFYQLVEEGRVNSLVIREKSLSFTKDGNKEVFETDNPGSADLKERMLLKGISVKEEKGADQWISLIFDGLFYLVFFGIFATVFVKFISPNTFKVVHKTGVKFKDIVGMENLKSDFSQIVEILKAPAQYAKKGIRLPKGILLEGAPGNGKTLFARALAGEAKVNFIPAKATDFESMFMAIGPMKVKLLFSKARRKAPCIVFIDEFDGIGTKRNYSGSAIETENTRIVTALLNELDGFNPNSGIVVVAATNSRTALDEALIRPGRFDAKYTVPYPDQEAREELCRMYLNGKNFDDSAKPEKISALFKGFSCAQIESIINRAAIVAVQQKKNSITIEEINLAMKEI
ncbi:MAG: ATP-dependent metallopeptidase FtsH/Yme1/Tma family protein [Treponema sp.]|nr:ATP-dependent metallopeptidase FtsH/Yme1/Tma family protein [Treponema sp.]